jgi:hypothetical protein
MDKRGVVWKTSNETLDAARYIRGYGEWYTSGGYNKHDIEYFCNPITAAEARRIIKGGAK